MGKENVNPNQFIKKRQKLQSRKGLARLKTRVIVIVDGNTEIAYFQRLNELDIVPGFIFKPICGDEESYATIFKENYDIKHKYLILDIDNCPTSNNVRGIKLQNLLDKKDLKNNIFYNNYSFEIFLINHKKKFAKAITAKNQYDRTMKKEFGVNGWSNAKNTTNLMQVMDQITREDIPRMICNIQSFSKGDMFANPNSNMHLLFIKIQKESE